MARNSPANSALAGVASRARILDSCRASLSSPSLLPGRLSRDPLRAPFLKWAGGKQWLAPLLANALPECSGTYFEPFLGAGALFFAYEPPRAVLADSNRWLMETFTAVSNMPEAIMRHLHRWPYNKKVYYDIRSRRFRASPARAAQMIYLNRTCWNGLFRVNQRGEFNVPFGRFKNPTICNEDRIIAASKALRGKQLLCADFEETVASARRGDMVYLDPPYTVKHENNGFLRYNEQIFSWHDQTRLAEAANALVAKGCRVIVSNAWDRALLKLYRGFFALRVSRRTNLAADTMLRSSAHEAIFSSFDLDLPLMPGSRRGRL